MDPRRLLTGWRVARVASLAMLAAVASDAAGAPPAAYYGPNGNGTLVHSDDLRWVAFRDARIVADEDKGEYRAAFSPALSRLNGQPFTITGYMLPMEVSTHSAHFILTRRSTGCPFCPPNEPTEAIEIFAARPLDYTQAPVTLRGRLTLVARSEAGLFYRLDQAVIG